MFINTMDTLLSITLNFEIPSPLIFAIESTKCLKVVLLLLGPLTKADKDVTIVMLQFIELVICHWQYLL